MNTNALAFMWRELDQQVGLRFEALELGTSDILSSAYLLFKSNSKQPFGYIFELNIGKMESLKCTINLCLNNQYSGFEKVYSGYK